MSRTVIAGLILLSSILLVAGCGETISDQAKYQYSMATVQSSMPATITDPAVSTAGETLLAQRDASGAPAGKLPEGSGGQQSKRQIIYTGSVSLSVQDFSEIPQRIVALVRERGGYVANSNLSLDATSPRHGTWTIRLVGDQFDGFVESIRGLGVITSASSNSQDVTQEFYDLEARIRNKQQQEARILKHMETSTRNLDEIFKVEQELSRVREEVERLQGRLRVLQDVTALSTITLQVNEFVQPTPTPPVLAVISPTFGERLDVAFAESLLTMLFLAQECTIFFAVVGPWLLLIFLISFPSYIIVRQRIARQSQSASS